MLQEPHATSYEGDVPTKAEILRVRSLREKKARENAGLFVVEGVKTVQDLIDGGMRFEAIYGTEKWEGPCTQRVSATEMERMSHFPTPSPVLALGPIKRVEVTKEALKTGITLALDGVQDPGNVGTLIRIADWFGIDRVVLSPDCADLFSQKVINASMCSFSRVSVHTAELPKLLEGAKATIIGCDLQGEDVHQLHPTEPTIIVIGSEGRGISGTVRKCVSRWVTIPRHGGAESLNAAVAGAIVCDNLRRLMPRTA